MELISFSDFCADVCEEPLTPAWQAFYAALDGEQLTSDQAELFEKCAGRPYVRRRHRTAVACVGRNGQKTWSSLKRLVYRSIFADSWITIRRGERPAAISFSQDMRVSGEAMAYLKSLFQLPLLRGQLIDEKAAELFLRNGVIIRILPCSVKAPRGWRIFDAHLDEISVWETSDGASDQDSLVAQSIAPAMALFGQTAETRITSTPWRQEGLLYDLYKRRSELLDSIIWQADTLTMNPSFPVEEIDRAQREFGSDYVAREFLASFTSDISGAFPTGDIDACTVRGRTSLPHQKGNQYVIALDSAGGGADAFTCAVAHRDPSKKVAFDFLKGWSVRRQGLDLVLKEIKALMQLYGTYEATGDQFAYDALEQLFRDRKMGRLKKLDETGWTSENKSRAFIDFRIALAMGQVELLDHAESLGQLRSVEAMRTSGGSVRYAARRGHDDFASVLVLGFKLLSEAAASSGGGSLIVNRGGAVSIFRGEAQKPKPPTAAPVTIPNSSSAKPAVLSPDDPSFWPPNRGLGGRR